jgi:hypothetical protein
MKLLEMIMVTVPKLLLSKLFSRLLKSREIISRFKLKKMLKDIKIFLVQL